MLSCVMEEKKNHHHHHLIAYSKKKYANLQLNGYLASLSVTEFNVFYLLLLLFWTLQILINSETVTEIL